MSGHELGSYIEDLRGALQSVDVAVKAGQVPGEAVRDLGFAVDNLRKSVWTLLTTEHASDYEGFLGRLRVRRATETCEEVLADLYADTIAPNTPGLEVLRATLRELAILF